LFTGPSEIGVSHALPSPLNGILFPKIHVKLRLQKKELKCYERTIDSKYFNQTSFFNGLSNCTISLLRLT
jgi:hypothetical protein